MFEIETYKKLEDDYLRKAWHELYNQCDYCPQLSYEWNFFWWKWFQAGDKRSLNVIVLKKNGVIIAIAPFMIEKNSFITQLKFIGSGLTDFHHVLVHKATNENEVLSELFQFLYKNLKVDLINFEQIPNNTQLCRSIKNQKIFLRREMISCPIVNFPSMSWDDYLLKLSKNQRQGYKKKLRRLEKEGILDFKVITSSVEMKENLEMLFNLHVHRWDSSGSESKFADKDIREFIQKAISEMKEIRGYILTLNDQIIAYRFGFIRNKVFYDWNTSFDPKFSYFSAGLVLTGLVLKDLLENGFEKFNFMRGNYDYKRRWMTDDETIINYQFLHPVSPIFGKLSVQYYLKWKWFLKRNIEKFAGNKFINKIKNI